MENFGPGGRPIIQFTTGGTFKSVQNNPLLKSNVKGLRCRAGSTTKASGSFSRAREAEEQGDAETSGCSRRGW